MRIKEARKKAGLTQKELGERLGLSFQSIAQWENDLRRPKIDTVKRIATALDCSVEWLMGWDEIELLRILQTGEGQPSDETRRSMEFHLEHLMKRRQKEALQGAQIREETSLLMNLFSKLNTLGQQEAIKRVEELTEIPRYRAEPPTEEE